MSRLSATDALFKYADSKIAPMNMGSVLVLKPRPAKGEDFVAAYRDFVAARLDRLPKLKKRMVDDGIGLPAWVDAGEPDLDYHVRRTSVQPGSERELFRKLGRLQHVAFDFSRPLFMFYVIEGLPDGKIAIMQKFHHAFADGKTATRLLELFSDEGERGTDWGAEPEPVVPSGKIRRMASGALEDLRRTLSSIPAAAGAARAMVGEGSADIMERMRSRPVTIFNRPLSGARQFAYRDFPQAQFTEMRRKMGLTFVEAGLVLLAGALRRYLDELDELPAESLVCNVPVAIDAGGKTTGNAVLAMWVALNTDVADRAERATRIKAEADASKKYLSRVVEAASAGRGVELPSLATRVMALAMGSPVLSRLNPPPGNVSLSSVPTSSRPIHVLGSQVESLYGMPMVLPGQGVSVTISAYAGKVVCSVMCCEKAMPEPERLMDYMKDELDVYRRLVLSQGAGRKSAAARGRSRARRAD